VGKIEGKSAPKIQEWKDISQVPYSEPSHMRTGWSSPFYTEKHIQFRKAIREYLDINVRPWCEQAELDDSYPPQELFQRLGQDGFLAAVIGDKRGLKMVPRLPGGIKPEEFDYFCEGIVHEECGRLGTPGATDGILAGLVISLPLVLNFGFADKSLGPKVAKEVLLGNKRMVLAVTEPFVGSDVANVRMTATKSADGSYYILNGVKKWISSAMPADYFMTLARTGGPGAGGLSYFMVERSEGLETKQISTSYAKSAGTALVIYENVKVPASHLLSGKEGDGFRQAMINFSHERWLIIGRMISTTRYALEEAWKWAIQREVFGKPLITQPVIRLKLGDMSARLEAVQAWYENITFQMTRMSFVEQGVLLSGPMALLKYEATRIGALIADQTPQILGGRAITKTGLGRNVERFMRTYKFGAIVSFKCYQQIEYIKVRKGIFFKIKIQLTRICT
jgi:alkylation response protein AidB-like acyl-CoA dehydrogenase